MAFEMREDLGNRICATITASSATNDHALLHEERVYEGGFSMKEEGALKHDKVAE